MSSWRNRVVKSPIYCRDPREILSEPCNPRVHSLMESSKNIMENKAENINLVSIFFSAITINFKGYQNKQKKNKAVCICGFFWDTWLYLFHKAELRLRRLLPTAIGLVKHAHPQRNIHTSVLPLLHCAEGDKEHLHEALSTEAVCSFQRKSRCVLCLQGWLVKNMPLW